MSLLIASSHYIYVYAACDKACKESCTGECADMCDECAEGYEFDEEEVACKGM